MNKGRRVVRPLYGFFLYAEKKTLGVYDEII